MYITCNLGGAGSRTSDVGPGDGEALGSGRRFAVTTGAGVEDRFNHIAHVVFFFVCFTSIGEFIM